MLHFDPSLFIFYALADLYTRRSLFVLVALLSTNSVRKYLESFIS